VFFFFKWRAKEEILMAVVPVDGARCVSALQQSSACVGKARLPSIP